MPVLIDKILRVGEGKQQRELRRIASRVNSIEDDFTEMSDEELREQTDDFRKRFENGESLDDLIYEAFATVREAARRTLGQRHYDVQLMGGAALHKGNVAEMRTGEGKTLVSTLPAYLNAIAGEGVHIVTVNDYLAKRDAEWMGRVHQFLGLEVSVVHPELNHAARRKAYAADITYGTNSEFGFDYLRDNMAGSLDECVQRGHFFAVVDEVDSILIDEARTPLIISGAADQATKWYAEFAKIAPRLKREADYEIDEKKQTVGILETGVDKVEDHLGIENLYEAGNSMLVSFLNNAIRAKELYKKDKDYVVTDGEVLIVDEFTGRILYGRRYNEGLHQAIEAKEGVAIQQENQTLATITLQNYFRMYKRLSGMTGTAMTEANEFWKTYKLGVVPIPTNKPMIRADEADVVYKTEEAKFDAVADDVADRHDEGQPVLIGTTSVEKSEYLSRLLKRRGVTHEVLNAKYHAKEATIVAKAGRKSAVTVATNMAGRGTDIVLGGNPEFEADLELHKKGLTPLETPEEYEAEYTDVLSAWKEKVAEEHEEVVELGGMYVLGTERHESRRIDNQLRGRSGRQGDPGESRFYLSLEDELMRRFNANVVDSVMTRLNIPDDVPIESKMVTRSIRSAQTQVEQQNFETRKNVLKYDEVMNRQREVIYSERRQVLEGADLSDQVHDMIDDVVEAYVRGATAEGFSEDWDLDQLWTAFKTLYPVSVTLDELEEESGGREGLAAELIEERIKEDAHEVYAQREEELGSDGMRELERDVMMEVLDHKWREHLYEMDYLKEGIGLRAMAQRDPLIEYQREGFELFTSMMDAIKEESIGVLFNVDLEQRVALKAARAAAKADAEADSDAEAVTGGGVGDDEAADEKPARPAVQAKGFTGSKKPQRLSYSAPSLDGDGDSEAGRTKAATATDDDEFAGTSRNAPCPCGSGRKFKRCHGDPRNRE
ncbi:MAG: preprotein translocase subunit SecA [Streptosporangiales bacterium]|nr:preprotein translocase subunit SecA [Streptosporangiales bacterium]